MHDNDFYPDDWIQEVCPVCAGEGDTGSEACKGACDNGIVYRRLKTDRERIVEAVTQEWL